MVQTAKQNLNVLLVSEGGVGGGVVQQRFIPFFLHFFLIYERLCFRPSNPSPPCQAAQLKPLSWLINFIEKLVLKGQSNSH